MDYTALVAVALVTTPFYIWLFWVTALLSRRAESTVGRTMYNIVLGKLALKMEGIVNEFSNSGESIIPAIMKWIGGEPCSDTEYSIDGPLPAAVDSSILTTASQITRVGSRLRTIRPIKPNCPSYC